MKLSRSVALILMTCCAAAVFAWSHADSRARKAVAGAGRKVVENSDGSLVLAGTIGPAIMTPVIGRNWDLTGPSNTGVDPSEAVGAQESRARSVEMDSARQELDAARSAEQRAEDEVRQAEEDLGTIQNQASSMDSEKARAEIAEVDAEREFERRDALLRTGLTSRFDYDTAVTVRESAEEAVDSIGSKLAETSVETDVLEAKVQEAEADLREATTRGTQAEVVIEQMEAGSQFEPVTSPGDGSGLAPRLPEGIGFEAVPNARHLYGHAGLRPADLMAVQVGQKSLIVLDAKPSVTFSAKVSAISEEPIESSDGTLYIVTFVVDNPGGTSFTDAAMHVRMIRSGR